uniref:AlNc14C27G2611 protein n=1 Tax=Albugo laibachii Nc14 TaxID=890382 RepID=F0W6X5_9STRA|nr:AlNc14C27G2611 [Albugo laibachii Nc14]|eukprot:CCA16870.1 AlNc14C27G2611 [Albugo laibachii Nc14]
MTKQQVMSPSPPEDPPAALLDALDNAKSVSAEISEPSEHGTSECGTDRLDRMERLIGDLMRDMVRERVEHKKGDGSTTTLVGVYVDDLLVTGTSVRELDQFFKDMCALDVKDLEEVRKFLGIGVTCDEVDGYHLEQAQGLREFLTGLRMEQANSARTPIGEEQEGEDEGDLSPSDDDGKVERPTVKMFKYWIGSLL